MGRPTLYTPELAESICDRIANKEPLHAICLDDGMPSERSVYRWLAEREDFRQDYAGARERAADKLAAEVIEIADTPVMGVKTVTKVAGVEMTEGDMIEHRRLQVDARKWYAGKLSGKYSEKVRQEVSGPNGAPIKTTAVPMDLSGLTDAELDALEHIHRKLAVASGGASGEGAPAG